MSDLQKEAATCKIMASRYELIKKVYPSLEPSFKLIDLLKIAGIKDGPNTRMTVGAILFNDFKCTNVGIGLNRVWKKP